MLNINVCKSTKPQTNKQHKRMLISWLRKQRVDCDDKTSVYKPLSWTCQRKTHGIDQFLNKCSICLRILSQQLQCQSHWTCMNKSETFYYYACGFLFKPFMWIKWCRNSFSN